MTPFYFGFGVIILGYFAIYGGAISLPFAFLLYYLIRFRSVQIAQEEKLFFKTPLFLLCWLSTFVVAVVVLFAGLSGNEGQEVKVYGIDIFGTQEHYLLTFPLVAAFVILFTGRVLLQKKHQQLREKTEAPTED